MPSVNPNLNLGIIDVCVPQAQVEWLQGAKAGPGDAMHLWALLGVWGVIHLGRGKELSMLSFSFILQHSVRTHFLLGDIIIWQSSDCEEFTSKK